MFECNTPTSVAAERSAAVVSHARPRCQRPADLTTIRPDTAIQFPRLTPRVRQRVENFIEAHLEMPLSVEYLARLAGMSGSHFTRAFRNALDTTPHRYVMWRRLRRAQSLIKDSDESLADIALLAGFCDQSHLCRLFHTMLGESPSRFRRRCRCA